MQIVPKPAEPVVTWTQTTPTDIILHGLLAATLYGLLGILLIVIGFKFFDWMTPRIDVQRELAEHKNVAVAIVIAAIIVGVALMLGRVMSA